MRRIAARPAQRQRSTQRGQALLVMAAMLIIGFAATYYALYSPTNVAIERDKITTAALAQAKEALIGYAASDSNRPGSLPCPDTDNNGGAESPFTSGTECPSYIGRLPWRTLGLPDLRDGSGERLWYAVTREFARNPTCYSTCPLNSDTNGTLTITGTSSATNVIAIVFAPGQIVSTQNRSTANENTVANYLDGGNETGIATSTFTTGLATNTFNDRLLIVTNANIMPVVEKRVARELLKILQDYKTRTACACTNLAGNPPGNLGCYPWPDLSNGISDAPPLDLTPNTGRNRGRIPALGASPHNWGANPCGTALPTVPTWFVNNEWGRVVYYSAGKNFLGPTACFTCVDSTLTVDGVAGKEVVILMPGPILGAPPRTIKALDDLTYWQDYFEDPANRDFANDVYVTPTSTAYTRDRIFTIP